MDASVQSGRCTTADSGAGMRGPRRGGERVRVAIRCRPLNEKEVAAGREVVVDLDRTLATVKLRRPQNSHSAGAEKTFTYDAVYDWKCDQQQIYGDTAVSIVESVLEGYNGTIFAYGQTGTGKTHTMIGPDGSDAGKGIIPRAFEHIFSTVACSTQKKHLVRVSFLEIYSEEIRDLLSPNHKERLELRDHPDSGIYVKDLSTFVIKSAEEMRQAMVAGQRNRKVGATLMNIESSRSHSIFTITVESCDIGQEQHIRVGKLNLVDLAGSERQAKTCSTGEVFKEAAKINLSLSALGNVISALVDSRTSFIPYRDSKLTRLLQDSLGGNTKTVMIASIGPADYNYDETLSTLRYAHRAKSIKNKPQINEDPKDAMIRAFQDEIAKLKAELAHAAALPREIEKIVEVEKQVVVPVEKEVVVEKIVEKLVPSGLDTAELRKVEMAAEKEKQLLKEAFEQDKKRCAEEAEQERKKLTGELEAKMKEQEIQRKHQLEMAAKLKLMEEKIIQGSQAMKQALQQEEQLRKIQLELEQQRQKELQMKRDLERQQMERVTWQEKYNSREEQIDGLTKKLENLWSRFKTALTEIEDLQCEFQAEREDFLATIRELSKQAQLHHLIIDNFIPTEEVEVIKKHSHWDEEAAQWIIDKLDLAGNNIQRTKKAEPRADVSQYAGNAASRADSPGSDDFSPVSKYLTARRQPPWGLQAGLSVPSPPRLLLIDGEGDARAEFREQVEPAVNTVLSGKPLCRPLTSSSGARRRSSGFADAAPFERSLYSTTEERNADEEISGTPGKYKRRPQSAKRKFCQGSAAPSMYSDMLVAKFSDIPNAYSVVKDGILIFSSAISSQAVIIVPLYLPVIRGRFNAADLFRLEEYLVFGEDRTTHASGRTLDVEIDLGYRGSRTGVLGSGTLTM